MQSLAEPRSRGEEARRRGVAVRSGGAALGVEREGFAFWLRARRLGVDGGDGDGL